MTDLERLLADRVDTSATLDFERELPSDDELPRRIAAFANGDGGCLFFGVTSRRLKSGARRIIGAPGISRPADVAVPRLHASLGSIDPAIAGIGIYVTEGEGQRPVIELHVPPSVDAPHAVGGVFRVRRGTEYADMTAAEIGAAGQRRNDVKSGMAELIASRLASIRNGSAPVTFSPERPPLLAVHLVPRAAFVGRPRMDFSQLEPRQHYDLRPLRSQKGHVSFDDDGFVTMEESDAYTRLLRDGTVEAVGIVPRNVRLNRLIDVNLVDALRDAVCRYSLVQEALGAAPPLFLYLALLNAQGYTIGTAGSTVDREAIQLGPAIVYTDPLVALRQLLDRLWQMTGRAECPIIFPKRAQR